jgi:hypothetical protein
MTNLTQPANYRIEAYLNRLDASLAATPQPERQDILCEIRAHILDSIVVPAGPDAAIDRVLHSLGTPEELALRYNTERMLTRASHSFSPWLLLRTTWRWAKVGVKGTIAFFIGLIGYSLALAFTVLVVLKPFRKAPVGVWWGNDNFIIGVPAHPQGMHELLGQWFVPVMIASAFALAVGTTQALRWLIRRRTQPMPL